MDFPLQLFLYSRRTTLAEQVKAQHQYPHQFQPARSWGQLGCWDTRITPNLALAGGPLGTTIPRASGTGLSPPKPGVEHQAPEPKVSVVPGRTQSCGLNFWVDLWVIEFNSMSNLSPTPALPTQDIL